ncbi:MAG: monovalent cation/H+ antiporter subunit D family protein [Planctomycetota bacterium]|nr:monovalent cation/H+ antiporter subunit D family protein [Planctomycetota bacterium]
MPALADILRDATPMFSIGVCLLAVIGIVLARRSPNTREGVSLVAAIVNFGLVLWMWRRHSAGEEIAYTLGEIAAGISIAFRVDSLGLIFALVASSLWIVNTLYSIGYMRSHDEHKQTRFFSCFAISIAAVMGGAFAANLITLFACYELLTICTYPLVIHAETDTAKAGAKRYVIYLLGTSIGFQLPALFLAWFLTGGNLDWTDGALLAGSDADAGLLLFTFVLFLFGMAKCGVMPFHSWLPAAMVAPTPVSALLHAVAVVKMGVFGVSRVVFSVFGTDLIGDIGADTVLVGFACFTIVVGSLVALVQDNLKRRLAYSTISQLSYVLLGVGLLVPFALDGGWTYDAGIGGLVHIAMHAFSKITLFFAAGAIYVAHHKTKVSELDGIGRRMPITMGAFTIGAFSMIGLPLTAGAVSKWYLVGSAVDGAYTTVLVVIVISALLNAAYFLPIVWRAFFRPYTPSPDDPVSVAEAPWPCVVALSVTGVLTVVLFFFPDVFVDLATAVAGQPGEGP